MNILALDMSSKTGWAYICGTPPEINSGVQEFKLARGESPGSRFMRFNKWLSDMLAIQPKVIVFEQAHHRGGPPTELAVGFVTRVLEQAAMRGIETFPVHSGTLKLWATGYGKSQKPAMIEAAQRRYGVKIIDDNHADALLLLAYGVEKFGGGA